ncbi:MAG: CarD family transcriptional regulator, partial [Patescibacteria group bacterium]|nr:CarD family transcriptional regulator [Patescibacteria group bacterium]
MKQKAVGQTWMKSFEQNPHVKKMAGDFLVSVDDAIVCNKLPWVRIEAVECAELLLNVLSRVARKSILGLIIKPALDASALSKFAQDDLVGIPTQASKIELGDLRSHAEKVLQNTGLEYRKKVWSPCEYTIMGDVFTVWPVGYANPVRIEFNNGCVETITLLDSMLRRSTCKLASVFLVSRRFEEALDVRWSVLSKGVNSGVLSSPLFFSMLGPVGLEQDLNTCVIDSDIKPTSWDDQKIESLLKNGWEVWFVVNHHLDRVRNIQNRYPGVKIFEEELPSGFESKLFKLVVLTDRELWGTVKLSGGKPVKKKSIEGKYSELTLGEITPGDYVVHEDYGVALYTGLKDLTEKQSHNGEKKFLELRYAKKDKLLVPVSQSHRLTKYVGVKAQTPKLTRLGGGEWKRVKKKVSESVRKLAAELLRMYAVREVSKVKPLKSDVSLLHSLEQEFEFVETDDQMRSLSEIFHDLGSATPMDRLLVGDVGFGKTEVAIRTAFWVAVGGGQVALLAPTTILVEQHYHVFK